MNTATGGATFIFMVPYTCHTCGNTFVIKQHSPELDEDITLCFPCIDKLPKFRTGHA